jgi:hypothetical protein
VRLSRLQDRPVLPGDVFECLGRVKFEGAVYLGYRVRFGRVEFELASAFASSETKQRELSRKPQDNPKTGVLFSSIPKACSPLTTLCLRRINSAIRETKRSTLIQTTSGSG